MDLGTENKVHIPHHFPTSHKVKATFRRPRCSRPPIYIIQVVTGSERAFNFFPDSESIIMILPIRPNLLDDTGRELPVDRIGKEVQVTHIGRRIMQELLGKRPLLPHLKVEDMLILQTREQQQYFPYGYTSMA